MVTDIHYILHFLISYFLVYYTFQSYISLVIWCNINIVRAPCFFFGQSLIKIGQCWLQQFEIPSHTGPWLVQTDHVTWTLDCDWPGRISRIILAVINYQLLFWYCESLGPSATIDLTHYCSGSWNSQHQTRTHYSDLLVVCFEVLDKSICIYPQRTCLLNLNFSFNKQS